MTAEVGLVDVAPTLLALAGVDAPAGLRGRRLPQADSAAAPGAPSVSYYHFADEEPYEAWSLRDGRWKLAWVRWRSEAEPRVQLFDLDADPGERAPLSGDPERVRELSARLEARRAAAAAVGSRSIELGPEMREELRALGYASE